MLETRTSRIIKLYYLKYISLLFNLNYARMNFVSGYY